MRSRRKTVVNDDLLELQETTLMSLLRAVSYGGSENGNPIELMSTMLLPYRIRPEQISLIVGSLWWGRPSVSNLLGHMVMSEVSDHVRNSKTANAEAIKYHFVYIATLVSHIWCVQLKPTVFVCENSKPVFYKSQNTPVPYVWFIVDLENGLIQVKDGHASVPHLAITLVRPQDKRRGQIDMEFSFDGGSDTVDRRALHMTMAFTKDAIAIEEAKCVFPEMEMKPFVVMFTEAPLFRLMDVVLVSAHSITSHPVATHLLPHVKHHKK